MELLSDVHEDLPLPCDCQKVTLVKHTYKYYHYRCDGTDDRGWGCGYRTMQTLCSWIQLQQQSKIQVPSIPEIQKALYAMGDKELTFVGSRDWIGSFEISICIDYFYKVPCKIIHVNSGTQLSEHFTTLENHFENIGAPVMMGGDKDSSSKGILGSCRTTHKYYLLVLDPHYCGKTPVKKKLQEQLWVKWQPLDDFMDSSFYNLCMPQFLQVDDETSV